MVADVGATRTKPAAVLIAGPTASGKSRLAMAVAAHFDGVVVNADSMQVYRDVRVLTARPGVEDEARIPHHLYGRIDAADRYSVGRWQADVRALLAGPVSPSRVPVFTGGTGLYFRALTEGLTAVPPVPAEIRARLAEETAGSSSPALHARLAELAPEDAERLRPSDRGRIVRALEVVAATGRSLTWWHREHPPEPLLGAGVVRRVILMPARARLQGHISERVDAMIAQGAVDEVGALVERGLSPNLPAMKAIGVRQLAAHLDGRSDLAAAASAMAVETRRYAKRQATWFRHQMAGWPIAADHNAALDALHHDE
ncbi:MAG: tRNA (adenosine(37)-N6)-dimethylallyltransferase MiaA [Alphaproteobacteria bacterium]